MGQYHNLVNMTAREHLYSHDVGNGLKAWEQTGGGTPAALTFLIAANPGNMPADIGQHPMAGRWAGHRLLAIGDYAEKSDLKKFDGPPLDRLYSLCSEVPALEKYTDRYYWSDKKNGSSQYGGYSFPSFTSRRDGLKRYCETAAQQYRKAMNYHRKLTSSGKYELIQNIAPAVIGALEFALSVRFCGARRDMVDVHSHATRGKDGHLHYRIADHIAKDISAWEMTLRFVGLGGWKESPHVSPWTDLQPNGDRWPWDRPAANLAWDNATDIDQDLGPERVFVNLDRAEYFDPRVFGEVPTTLGIMRAAQWDAQPMMCLDMALSSNGSVATDVKTTKPQFSSAGALWAMLLHPEVRGGGDISATDFPLIGQWRNCQIALVSERSNGVLPTTDEVRDSHHRNRLIEIDMPSIIC